MLDNLFNLVKQQAGDAIINNPTIPNQKNDEAVQMTHRLRKRTGVTNK